ncbi:alpha-L-rhamnosidase [Opitutaceae bacterium TAV1]|nr:alpha-L-rhamnosidase [Opitutaceae bacterium TAV1]
MQPLQNIPPLPALNAQWIWPEAVSSINAWAAFRHSFSLPPVQGGECSLQIASADKYWLWVNGRLVIREGGLKSGPTRSGWYVDETEVSAWLQPGINQLALLVWHFGHAGASHRNSGQGGLCVQLRAGGEVIVSNRAWRARQHPAFGQSGAGTSITLAEQAVDFDGRSDMPGWTNQDFDDSGWPHPVELGTPPVAPWGTLVPRPIPQWRDGELRAYENRAGLSLPVTGPAVVTGRLPSNLQIYPWFRVRAPAGAVIEVKIERDKKTTRYTTREGEQDFEVPAWGNGNLVSHTLPEGVTLLGISYRETRYSTERAGRFSSSDPALDLLWRKAARTALLCLRDTFMDCPDRERSPWTGDAANIMEVTLRAFDRRSDALIAKTLNELAAWASPAGNLWGAVPTSRFPDAFREFPAQTLVMLAFGVRSYWMHTGDQALLRSFYPAMRRYLLECFTVRDGRVAHRGPWTTAWEPGVQCWYDWGDNIDAELLDQLLYFAALDTLRQSAGTLGHQEDLAHCERLQETIRAGFDSAWWSAASGGYRSPGHAGPPDDRAQALALLTGLAPAERHARLADLLEEIERCSIYMERYPLEALVAAGRPQSALRRLKRRFAAEIDSGSPTLPEHFGECSNHAWGGAAVVLLAEKLLGISILEPGFREVVFCPPREGLASADCMLPTVRGALRLSFERAGVCVRHTLSIPPCVRLRLRIGAETGVLFVNGVRHELQGAPVPSGLCLSSASKDGFEMLLAPGEWEIRAEPHA